MSELGEFNAEEHGEMQNFDPILPGKYEVMVVESEMAPTQTGDLNQLVLTWQVTDGEHQGRKIWTRINLPNRNHPVDSLADGKKKAIEIGGKELATICRALGKMRIADSAELHGIPCVGDVRIKPAGVSNKGVAYNASNQIVGYHPVGEPVGSGATSAPARSTPPIASKAAGQKTPPWVKK